jgi:hypothetical protein
VINRSLPLAAAIDLNSRLASRFCHSTINQARGLAKRTREKHPVVYTECCALYAKSIVFAG